MMNQSAFQLLQWWKQLLRQGSPQLHRKDTLRVFGDVKARLFQRLAGRIAVYAPRRLVSCPWLLQTAKTMLLPT